MLARSNSGDSINNCEMRKQNQRSFGSLCDVCQAKLRLEDRIRDRGTVCERRTGEFGGREWIRNRKLSSLCDVSSEALRLEERTSDRETVCEASLEAVASSAVCARLASSEIQVRDRELSTVTA